MPRFRPTPWSVDLALGLALAAAAHLVAGALDLYGRLAAWTRSSGAVAAWLHPEALPFSLLALAVAAAALAFRRHKRLARRLVSQDELERRAAFLAYHDTLTRLPNRALLRDRLQQALGQVDRGGWAALLLVDLDRFRDVNDVYGHAAGDLLLAEAAGRLRACARQGDTVARCGGDEFAVVLPRLERPADAAPVAERIVRELSRPYYPNGHEVRLGASVGVSVYPDDGARAEQLLRNADLALAEAKQEWRGGGGGGGGAFRFFLSDMGAQVAARRALEAQLRSAVARADEEFELFYQPVVDLADGRVGGVEALLRWRHPERGLLLPPAFVAAAEDSGLIVPIDDWVLRTACARARVWRERVWREEMRLPLRVAVNLSRARLLHGDIAADLAETLRAAGVEPAALELELTERVFAGRDGGDAALGRLRGLHEMGVQLALDDFGTGASSLALLKRFPGQRLKIDRAFVRDMLRDPGDAAIVRATVNLGHSLGLRVVAEGVETEEQLDFLRVQGCDEVQGHRLARPQPAAELTRLLRRDPASHAGPTTSAARP